MRFLIGKKIEMSQMFDEKGNVVPVTLIEAGPCYVLQKKTKDKDGYGALQIGFVKIENPSSRTLRVHYGAGKSKRVRKSWKARPYKYVREFRGQDENIKIGDEINVSNFKEGDKVIISGVSKGKGFQGAVKRHGFSGREATHGAKHEARTLGSVGQRFPQHVIKGRKMPGRMGYERVTVKNLKIAKIDKDNNLIAVKGAVPGHRGTLLEIRG